MKNNMYQESNSLGTALTTVLPYPGDKSKAIGRRKRPGLITRGFLRIFASLTTLLHEREWLTAS